MDPAKHAALIALRTVIDPEVGLDVVTMGLLYGLEVDASRVAAKLTLTSPGCPMGGTILRMAEEALDGIAGERAVDLELVWDPPWNPGMITEEGHRRLRPY